MISCIFNDGGYGSEFHKLRAEGLREDGANFGYSDLFRIAEGFGIKGYRIDNLVQLREALSDLSKTPTAAVLDIRVSPSAMSPVIARAIVSQANTDHVPATDSCGERSEILSRL